MQFEHLRSLFSAHKTPIAISESIASFSVATQTAKPYIEPDFEKVIFKSERPAVVLISAVGATGKTTLAERLSATSGLPLLNLAKHKPVGDNSLTGVLTQAFSPAVIGQVIDGLKRGSFGLIIDGIDEGRSMTSAKAFEAFLDDIARLCGNDSGHTKVLMLGRTQILDETFVYLDDHDVSVGLVTISPFGISQATAYIDAYTGVTTGPFAKQYREARDTILKKLGNVFGNGGKTKSDDFLAFIGYPPVLDAIVTLLKEEKNYHKLIEELGEPKGSIVEIALLHRIAQYVMTREREHKVLPNIVASILEDAPPECRPRAANAFSVSEQAIRLLSYTTNRPVSVPLFNEPVLDEQYENQISSWLPEHPFLDGRDFRNVVFESLAVATVIDSGSSIAPDLVREYFSIHKHSYHLIYMLGATLSNGRFSTDFLPTVVASAMEFRSVHSVVELTVDGPDWDDDPLAKKGALVSIGISIVVGDKAQSQDFDFQADIDASTTLYLGSRIGGAAISVPCAISMGGAVELELTAPLDLAAKEVRLDAQALIAKPASTKDLPGEILVSAQGVTSHVRSITSNGVPLLFSISEMSNIAYPLHQYARQSDNPPSDALLRKKFFRLKRILLEFRSHKKGALAKYRHKIEHVRVLKNEVGQSVLSKLIADGILVLRGEMYFLDTDKLSDQIGITWLDLRQGAAPESLLKYLRTVE